MRKLKVYLDTSVISYLSQEDAPERMKETLELWKDFTNGKYDIYLSQVTLDEIEKCPEPKRNVLYDYLSDIEYTKLEITAEILELAQKPNLPKLLYIGSKPIPQTAYKINDCGSFFFTNICINDII